MTSKELTKLAVAALEDRKAEDVTVIDISEIYHCKRNKPESAPGNA